MDTTPLRDAYGTLLDAAATVAGAGRTLAPPPGEWTAEQILAHVSVVTAATSGVVSAVAAGTNATFDNRVALDTWTIGRIVDRAGTGLPERLRRQGDALCALASALSEAELDTPVPTLILSHDELMVDQPLALRDIVDGIAEQELPRHAAQLLALLPAAAIR